MSLLVNALVCALTEGLETFIREQGPYQWVVHHHFNFNQTTNPYQLTHPTKHLNTCRESHVRMRLLKKKKKKKGVLIPQKVLSNFAERE